MRDVVTILLAAGLSRRMGAQNKLLLDIGGVPMIRHMAEVYRAATGGPILVVTGHQAEDIEAALAGVKARTVFNPDFAQGQPTSVACGLRAAEGAEAILIGLGDQPLLTNQDIEALLDAHEAADMSRISIPAMDQQRGNPIVVPTSLRARLLADARSPGCRRFTRAHPEHVQFHPLAAPGFYADVDTPETYAALAADTMMEIT